MIGRMSWKLAIFDWDGTLVDSREMAYRAACDIIRHFGAEPPAREVYLAEQISDFEPFYHRHGVPAAVGREELNNLWRKFFNMSEHNHPPLREGVKGILEICRKRGIHTAVVSGNIAETIQANMQLLNLADFIDHLHAGANGKVEELRRVVEHFRVSPPEAFYIDDTVEGLAAAKKVGVAAMGIEGGFNERQSLLGAAPDYILSSFADLAELLNKN